MKKAGILSRAFYLALHPNATTATVLRRLLRRECAEPEPQWEPARDDHGRELPGVRTRVMTAEEIEADRADRAGPPRESWLHQRRAIRRRW